MAHNITPSEQPAIGAFDPNPDPAMLVRVGVYISSSAILAMLETPPRAVMMSCIHMYAFGVSLAMIFLFGLGMIAVGWFFADYPTRYTAWGRIMTRASHVVLVFAIALHEVASTSATHADTTHK